MNNVALSLAGLPSFLLYFALGLALFAAFFALYVRVTPYHELELIREGNVAAAISLAGALLGFVLPLASAIVHSVSALDMIVWGIVAFRTRSLLVPLLTHWLLGLYLDLFLVSR